LQVIGEVTLVLGLDSLSVEAYTDRLTGNT
jgi:hypothetical protein